MKKLFWFFIYIFISCLFACSTEDIFRTQENNMLKLESVDAETTPQAGDLACNSTDSCVVVEKGCCVGEKIVALNSNSLSKFRAERQRNCSELNESKAKENIFNICAGRDLWDRLSTVRARCKDSICEIDENTDIYTVDAEISPGDSQSCKEGDTCVVIDKGCCIGEKRVAVNKNSLGKLKTDLRQNCTKLMAEKAKENIFNICEKRKVLGRFLTESPVCVNNKCEMRLEAKDAEITPSEKDDLSCKEASDTCTIIDKGCCHGEKPVAVNTKSTNKLAIERENNCSLFLNQNKDNLICQNREYPTRIAKMNALCNSEKKCEIDQTSDTYKDDSEISVTSDELSCNYNDECITIEKGCCRGEKEIALNKKNLARIKEQHDQNCANLFSQKAKEKILNLCQGREQTRDTSKAARCENKSCVVGP